MASAFSALGDAEGFILEPGHGMTDQMQQALAGVQQLAAPQAAMLPPGPPLQLVPAALQPQPAVLAAGTLLVPGTQQPAVWSHPLMLQHQHQQQLFLQLQQQHQQQHQQQLLLLQLQQQQQQQDEEENKEYENWRADVRSVVHTHYAATQPPWTLPKGRAGSGVLQRLQQANPSLDWSLVTSQGVSAYVKTQRRDEQRRQQQQQPGARARQQQRAGGIVLEEVLRETQPAVAAEAGTSGCEAAVMAAAAVLLPEGVAAAATSAVDAARAVQRQRKACQNAAVNVVHKVHSVAEEYPDCEIGIYIKTPTVVFAETRGPLFNYDSSREKFIAAVDGVLTSQFDAYNKGDLQREVRPLAPARERRTKVAAAKKPPFSAFMDAHRAQAKAQLREETGKDPGGAAIVKRVGEMWQALPKDHPAVIAVVAASRAAGHYTEAELQQNRAQKRRRSAREEAEQPPPEAQPPGGARTADVDAGGELAPADLLEDLLRQPVPTGGSSGGGRVRSSSGEAAGGQEQLGECIDRGVRGHGGRSALVDTSNVG